VGVCTLLVRTRAGLCELVTIWVIPPGVDENSAGASEENPGLGGVFLPQGTFSDGPHPLSPADFSAQSKRYAVYNAKTQGKAA
jgi:hypothetical protein